MRKNLFLIILLLSTVACSDAEHSSFTAIESLHHATLPNSKVVDDSSQNQFPSATTLYAQKARDEMVDGSGKVVRLLKDDNKGSRHQKFLVEMEGGQTLLFAHNIDLALRINALKVGDTISFRGEYEYNQKGGIVHWTHLDPRNVHEAGWIKHNGITYQ